MSSEGYRITRLMIIYKNPIFFPVEKQEKLKWN